MNFPSLIALHDRFRRAFPHLLAGMILGPVVCAMASSGDADSHGLYAGFRRSLKAENSYGYKLVSAPEPVREGTQSERFELRRGDCNKIPNWDDCANDRERSELIQLEPYSVPEKDYWYAWSLFIPENYPNIFPVKTCLGQFHQEGATKPPLMFQNGAGGYWLDLNQTGKKAKLLIPEKELKGKWHDMLVNARWSTKADGRLHVWVDGASRFSQSGANISREGKIFFKYGIYRSFLSRKKGDIPNQIVYFDAVRWGHSRKAVENPLPPKTRDALSPKGKN